MIPICFIPLSGVSRNLGPSASASPGRRVGAGATTGGGQRSDDGRGDAGDGGDFTHWLLNIAMAKLGTCSIYKYVFFDDLPL